MRLHLDFLHRAGWPAAAATSPTATTRWCSTSTKGSTDVVQRARARTFRPDAATSHEVITAQLAYFEAIGAMAEVDGPDGAPA